MGRAIAPERYRKARPNRVAPTVEPTHRSGRGAVASENERTTGHLPPGEDRSGPKDRGDWAVDWCSMVFLCCTRKVKGESEGLMLVMQIDAVISDQNLEYEDANG